MFTILNGLIFFVGIKYPDACVFFELRAGILREVKRLWASHGIAARVMKITLSTTEIKGTHRKWESKAE